MFRSAHELVKEAKKSIQECAPEDIEKRVKSAGTLVIDVREPDEYLKGYIPGAINIPRGLLEFRITNDATLQDIERPIVVYCKTSGRAALSVITLQSMGFKKVVSLSGGFDAWLANGQAVASH